MTRMIVGFDPSKAQGAIAELRDAQVAGVEWRVPTLDQNPNGVEPARPTPGDGEPPSSAGAEEGQTLLQRLGGWLSKTGEQAQPAERKPIDLPAPSGNPLELSEEELTYLRRSPAREATVIVVTAPGSQDASLRMWMVRHGGFNMAHTPVGADQA